MMLSYKMNYSSKLFLLCVRLSPSDGDSLGSDQSSGRESAEETSRPVATPSEGKQHRKTPKNGHLMSLCVCVCFILSL